MSTLNITWRNLKWHFQNPIVIVMTVLQPMIWLLLYSTIANQTMSSLNKGNYTAFILPGILVLVTFTSSGTSGMMNYIMKNRGSFYRIQISPIKRSSIVLGHIVEAVIVSLIEAGILIVLSLFLKVRIAAGFTGLFFMAVLLILTASFISGISYTLSLCLPNEEIFQTVITTIILPLFFVSPALFPMDQISGILKIAVRLNPFTYVINCLRGLIFEPNLDWWDIVFVTGIFLVLCFCSIRLSIWSLKRDGIH